MAVVPEGLYVVGQNPKNVIQISCKEVVKPGIVDDRGVISYTAATNPAIFFLVYWRKKISSKQKLLLRHKEMQAGRVH